MKKIENLTNDFDNHSKIDLKFFNAISYCLSINCDYHLTLEIT